MKTIRQNVFETNSSSMHAITVPAFFNTTRQEIQEILAPYKTENGYYIKVELDEKLMEGDPFCFRHNELHSNFMDKLLYAYGTMLEYWNRKLFRYDDYIGYRGMSFEEAKEKKYKEFSEFKAKANEYYIERFESILADLTKSLEDVLYKKLTGDYLYKYNSETKEYDKLGSFDIEFIYDIEYKEVDGLKFPEYIVGYKDKSDYHYFSLGCYDNIEFYHKVVNSSYTLGDWLLNKDAKIYASSDECDNDEFFYQAHKDIDDNYKNYLDKMKKRLEDKDEPFKEDIEEDLRFPVNTGCVVYPIGG